MVDAKSTAHGIKLQLMRASPEKGVLEYGVIHATSFTAVYTICRMRRSIVKQWSLAFDGWKAFFLYRVGIVCSRD